MVILRIAYFQKLVQFNVSVFPNATNDRIIKMVQNAFLIGRVYTQHLIWEAFKETCSRLISNIFCFWEFLVECLHTQKTALLLIYHFIKRFAIRTFLQIKKIKG